MHELSCDVYQAAMRRLEYIFTEFDNVYISFSGGKDSGVLVHLVMQYLEKNKLHIKPGLFHLDYEAQYSKTTEYVDLIYKKLAGKVDPLRCCVPVKEPVSTSMHQEYWRPWDENARDLWVRPMPLNCFKKDDFEFFTDNTTDYQFQQKFSLWYHRRQGAGKTCSLVGIRASESLNRWRTIAGNRHAHNQYQQKTWTTKIADNIYNAYPIYDWRVEDIWIANEKFGWQYNELYDLFYLAGLPLLDMRVDSPFHHYAKASLRLYRVIDPDMWQRLLLRVQGVNFTALYGSTEVVGWKEIKKPTHLNWQQYAQFLLKTLPEAMAENFHKKLKTDQQVSWRNLCIAILKKDYDCNFMRTQPNEAEIKRRQSILEKYENL